MPEQGAVSDAYAIQYSESGRAGRKDLPPEALSVLLDVLDALAANPDAFPGRVAGLASTEEFDSINILRLRWR
jgi:hypothetical protein